MRTAFRVTGFLAIGLALIGYFTVADDLRHTGELLAVSGLLLAGLALLAAGSRGCLTSRLAMQWIAVGIGIGAAFGAGMDNMALGVGGGAALGALLAFLYRGRGAAPCCGRPSVIGI